MPDSCVPAAPLANVGASLAPTVRPIIFSGPMVRALLAGQKTQTRRLLKPAPPSFVHYGRDIMDWGLSGIYQDEENSGPTKWWLDVQTDVDDNSHREINVRYAVGDRLYVQENFYTEGGAFGEGFGYAADLRPQDEPPKLTPCIHMPRHLSRITLSVTDVRVQRLQDISEEDARAEGAGLYVPGHGFITETELHADPGYSNYLAPRMGFEAIWFEIHGEGAWKANPWVVALTFGVAKRNVDSLKHY